MCKNLCHFGRKNQMWKSRRFRFSNSNSCTDMSARKDLQYRFRILVHVTRHNGCPENFQTGFATDYQHVGTMKMMLIDGLFLVQLLDNCELGEVVCTKEHKLGLPNTCKSTQLHTIFVQLPELLRSLQFQFSPKYNLCFNMRTQSMSTGGDQRDPVRENRKKVLECATVSVGVLGACYAQVCLHL